MEKSLEKIYNVGDVVSTTVFHRTGTIETKVFDQCKGEFVYSIKTGVLILVNVSSKEII